MEYRVLSGTEVVINPEWDTCYQLTDNPTSITINEPSDVVKGKNTVLKFVCGNSVPTLNVPSTFKQLNDIDIIGKHIYEIILSSSNDIVEMTTINFFRTPKEKVFFYDSTQIINAPEWATYVEMFIVNGGNGGNDGASNKGGNRGNGGNIKEDSTNILSGEVINIVVGNGGTASGGKGGTSSVTVGDISYAPSAQGDNTSTSSAGTNGTQCSFLPVDHQYATSRFGATGGQGGYNSGTYNKGGETGGGYGAQSNSRSKAVAGSFYGAGGGGGYGTSTYKVGAAGYKGCVILKFYEQY